MRSLIKTFTALLSALAVLLAFAACDGNISENSVGTDSNISEISVGTDGNVSGSSESTDGNVSESSESTGEKSSELLLYKVCFLPGTDYSSTKTYDYTEFGEISSETDVRSSDTVITKYEYNDNKKLISKTATDSNGKVTEKYEFEYNDLGLLVKAKTATDFLDSEALYSYDENNRVISINMPGFRQITYTYNEDGSYTTDTVLASGSEWQDIFDKNGLLIETNNADGNRAVYSYNEKGDILSSEYYNELGELKDKQTYTYDGKTKMQYNYEYDELTFIRKYCYDSQNNLIKTISIDGQGNETVQEEREYKLFDIIK